MKIIRLFLRAALLLPATVPCATATEVVIVEWGKTWDYLQPMGLDPAVADTDFNTTWFLKPSDFTTGYNGPVFGGATVVGDPSNPATFDQGSGPGPLGYAAIDYFGTGGAEVTGLGTTLSIPTTRYTAYFRTTFTTSQIYTSPRIRMILDDGALVYLDGVLVARVNKADNTEAYASLAADTTAGLNETGVANTNNEACVQSFSLATAGAGTVADSVVILPVGLLAPGEHSLAVSVRSNVTNSSDLCMGLQLLGNDAGISALATNVQRQSNGAGFADDTFSFDVQVTATNLPGAVSWTSNSAAANGPATGSYAPATATFTYPAQVDIGTLSTATILFTDSVDPLLTTTLVVTAPEGPPGAELVLSTATPSFEAGIEEAGMGLSSFSRRNFHSEMGFTSNGKVVPDGLANGSGSKMVLFNAVNGLLTTEAVKLDPAVKGVKASAVIRTYTSSTTGFEYDDSIRILVEGSPDGTVWTDMGSVMPTLYGNDPAAPLNPTGIDQILVKAGPGTGGLPPLSSRLGWATAGNAAGPASDTLTLPFFTVMDAQPLQMEFTHRYSFEYDGTRWDGGAVAVSVNGGAYTPVPGSAFTQNGYAGITITGNNVLLNLEGFNGDSAKYSEGQMITSILTLPAMNPGDLFQVQFLGAWDEFSVGSNPNWEINDIKIKSGATTIYSENFSTGDGLLTATPGWLFDNGTTNPGPSYFTFTRSALAIPAGIQYVRMKVHQPTNVVLSTSEFFLVDHLKLEVGLDPLADADGDGVNNGMEDLAGTGIADPLSAFKVVSEVLPAPGVPGSTRGTLSFPASDLRTYRFQSSGDLLNWTTLDTRYGDPAVPNLSLFSESNAPETFWRLSIGY